MTSRKEVWILQDYSTDEIIGVYSSKDQAKKAMKEFSDLQQFFSVGESNTDFGRVGGVIFRFKSEGFRLTRSILGDELTPLLPVNVGLQDKLKELVDDEDLKLE